MKWIVELQEFVYISTWRGDPGRTYCMSCAKRFDSIKQAEASLKRARQYRPFGDARIVEVSK